MKSDINRRNLEQSMLYSDELGINLKSNEDRELFKWFLASILFGARISETIAKNTYKTFEKYNLLTPRRILQAGWDFLISPIMSEGGYVRYDGKTSTQILKNCKMLTEKYGGSLKKLHGQARNKEDLEERLRKFYGIGPVTVNIFLRELRPYWKKADPEPLPRVREIAEKLKIDIEGYKRKSVAFSRLEAGLIRMRKQLKR